MYGGACSMKKILKIIASTISAIVLMFTLTFNAPVKTANANTGATIDEFNNTVEAILYDYVTFNDRLPGSTGEKNAGDYIISYLNGTKCTPYQNNYISDGIQTFSFESIVDGLYHTSRNIIFNYDSSVATDKKVIIGCSYDAIAYKTNEYGEVLGVTASESVNGSAGSVALLLALAKYLPQNSYNFDIQFVFFGAGVSNNAGSEFFTQGISDEDAENILLMINLDNVAVGKDVYFYVDEIENDFSKYAAEFLYQNEYDLKKISLSNIGKVVLDKADDLGLQYTHISLLSNNVEFMKSGVLTMNIFAGDYSSGVTLGRCEHSGKEVVAFTQNDNITYIKETYGENSIKENLYTAFSSIEGLLLDSQFETVCKRSFKQTAWIYVVFGNERFVIFLTFGSTLVLACVYMIIHYKLTKRAYYANIETGFVKTVLNITSNIGGKADDEDVPKFISEILVNDIKKDKRIKGKKK